MDYGEWKDRVAELEGILDEEDGKFDPKSEIEKEYANLEKLAQETKVHLLQNLFAACQRMFLVRTV